MSKAREARCMLRAHRYGALSTLSKKFSGHPFGSIAPYVVDHDGSLLIFISTLAEHTRNIQHDPRVSLITHDQSDPHIQSQGRVTVVGAAHIASNRDQVGKMYLRHFQDARAYLEMHDFNFYRITPIAIRYIGGFGKIHWVDMDKYAPPQAEQFAKQEETLLAELNTNQQSVLNRLLHQQHCIDDAIVQAIGLDCDGLTVFYGGKVIRLDFPEESTNPSFDHLIGTA